MYVAGLDVSTKAIDLVLVPLEDGPPVWHHYPLTGQDAWERVRAIPDAMPRRNFAFWDSILAVGLENPQARGPAAQNIATLHRAIGAVLACIPRDKLVQPWQPSEWRKRAGLPGNASKHDVRDHSRLLRFDLYDPLNDELAAWTQDAHDAHCIALATRAAIETQETA